MNEDKLALGIDTSNYKTSVAVVGAGGDIVADERRFLRVEKGKRGLRQSEALFQHVNNLPELVEKALAKCRGRIGCVAVSDRPRPVEGSYMPVFNAGLSAGRLVSAALGVPLYRFSHQEGHIEAVSRYASPAGSGPCVCFHFSGGTTEAVLTEDTPQGSSFTKVGGSLDIAYGQVLDRIGVAMGLAFPCGRELDQMAVSRGEHGDILSRIKVRDGFVNLSGIETQGIRAVGSFDNAELAEDLLFKLSLSIEEMTLSIAKKTGARRFVYAGGVSSSAYLREFIGKRLSAGKKENGGISFAFGKPELSTDNAVGIALLGAGAMGADKEQNEVR